MARLRSRWGPQIGIGVIVVLALPFVVHAVGRGMSMGTEAERAVSRFLSTDLAANWAIYGHMVLGGLLTGLAPVQMSGALRRRWPGVHRGVGRVVAGLALITGVAGLVYILRQGTIGGPVMSAGFALYGGLMILAAVQTVRFARLRDPRHAAWAGRLIILALASWFFRVQYGLWVSIVGEVGMTPGFTGAFDRVMTFGFYLPWLGLYELVRWWRGPRPVVGLRS